MSVAATGSALLIAYVEMPISRISSLPVAQRTSTLRTSTKHSWVRFGGERPN